MRFKRKLYIFNLNIENLNKTQPIHCKNYTYILYTESYLKLSLYQLSIQQANSI